MWFNPPVLEEDEKPTAEKQPMTHPRVHSSKLIPIASLLVLAISGIPVAVCSAMPGCPMTAADAVGMEAMTDCHPAQPAADVSCDAPQLTRISCCAFSTKAAPPVARDFSLPTPTPLPVVVAAKPASPVLAVASLRPRPHPEPRPGTHGRDLLSRHQSFLL